MASEENNLYEIDEDSWNERQQERNLYEVVREPIQNSMDTGSNIKVQVNYDDNSIVVEDFDEEGVHDLGNFYTLFEGTKAGDPEKRGRFGRGTKELVGASDDVVISSTGGAVRFDVEQGSRTEYEEAKRDEGTVVYASNPEWGEEDLDEVKEFVERIMPEKGMEIELEDDRGYESVIGYEEPDTLYNSVLETANGEERETEVEVRRTEEGKGGIYEMGIPVTWSEDFPFTFNIQQTVQMAEQRQDVDSDYRREVLHSLLREEMDFLQDSELTETYVTENLIKSETLPEEREIEYLERRFELPVDSLVVSSFSKYDDKAEQSGYEVLETSDFDSNVSSLMNRNLMTTKELAEHLQDSDKVDKNIEPNEVQQRFLDFVEDEIIDPIWSWGDAEPSDELHKTLGKDSRSGTPVEMGEKPDVDIAFRDNEGEEADRWAFYDPLDHTIYFNVAETEDNWEDLHLGRKEIMNSSERFIKEYGIETGIPEPQRIGVAVHEAAHAEADSAEHDKEWYQTMELMAGTLMQKLMIESRDYEEDNELLQGFVEEGKDISEMVKERETEVHRENEQLESRLESKEETIEENFELLQEEAEKRSELEEELEQEEDKSRKLEDEVERLEEELENQYESPEEYIRDKARGFTSKVEDLIPE